MAKRKTTAQFIQDARKVHGNKYEYSLVEYVKSTAKLKIICPEHGGFEQVANNHLRGQGCSYCVGSKKTTNQFIEDARKVHGDIYDYSLVEYVKSTAKVTIICPEHGAFWQQPNNHLMGKRCIKCANSRKITNQFIEDARRVHGNKYDYSLVEYVKSNARVKIICPDHGVFWKRPNNHLRGQGCFYCAGAKKTTNQFIEDARRVHGDIYDYSLVEYANAHTRVEIICPDHGAFQQMPDCHLQGSGCPKCANYGFNPDKPGLLYLIKFQKDFAAFWKIGITNRTIEDRFRQDALFIKERHEWQFKQGINAYQIEQAVMKQFQAYKQPPMLFPLLSGSGGTECFTPNAPHRRIHNFIERLANSCKDG